MNSTVSVKKSFHGVTSVVYADNQKVDFDSYRDTMTIRINNMTKVTIPMSDFVRVAKAYINGYKPTLDEWNQYEEDTKRLTPKPTPLEVNGYRETKDSLVKGYIEVQPQEIPEFFRQ